MRKSEGLEKTTTDRLPPAKHRERRQIDDFLMHIEHRVRRTLDEHRQLLMMGTPSNEAGQIQYWKHQLATIAWLRSLNSQRRANA